MDGYWYDEIKNNTQSGTIYKITIDLSTLTNAMLDNGEIIPNICKTDDFIVHIINSVQISNFTLNINKLMEKIERCKNLVLTECSGLKISRLPPRLEVLKNTHKNIILGEIPNTLKEYYHNTSTSLNESNLGIIPNISHSMEKIEIIAYKLDESFNNISYSIDILQISMLDYDFETILWPNCKSLYINMYKLYDNSIYKYCKKSIGILPYGLEELVLYSFNYEHSLVLLPPTLKYFEFCCESRYKYSEEFNNLLDSIEFLTMNTLSWPYDKIYKLPERCIRFHYYACSDDILEELRVKFPDCKITSKIE